MNKIITTYGVDPLVQQPFTADSLDFCRMQTKNDKMVMPLSVIGRYTTQQNIILFQVIL